MQLKLHLVSDSTGETLTSISRAVMSQFSSVELVKFEWFLVRSQGRIENIIQEVIKEGGIVLYTILSEDIEKYLVSECKKASIVCVPAISHIIDIISRTLKIPRNTSIGRQHLVDDEYYGKMEAINYTLLHDDGNLSNDLSDADIIIIGASRTSKTPTSIYLAYRGYRVANIPFVKESLIPTNLNNLTNSLIVGLVIDPERLEVIRKNRLKSIEAQEDTEYTDLEQIRLEVSESRRFFAKIGCPVINVTQKSVEETSVYILNLLKNVRRI